MNLFLPSSSPFQRWLVAILSALLLWAVPAPAAAQETKSTQPETHVERLITIESGEIPIILSAPHGGTRKVDGVSVRKGASAKQFVTVTDTNSHRLTAALAKSLERKWGKPYVVIAQFSRQYLDANRPASDAYESENAKPIYDAYHSALKEATTKIRERFGRGLLLDIHGQAAKKDTIFRGTSNGKTCSLLTERLGPGALMKDVGLLGILHAKGYEIFPAPGSDEKEDARYNGGHIVRTYGSSGGTGIDALQLELGGDFRKESRIEKTAEDLAEAINRFGDVYFSQIKIPSK
jgi:N-formylglutamate amidohydrolase